MIFVVQRRDVVSVPHTGKKIKACRLLDRKTDGKKTTWKIR
jgi:hypothetical protein